MDLVAQPGRYRASDSPSIRGREDSESSIPECYLDELSILLRDVHEELKLMVPKGANEGLGEYEFENSEVRRVHSTGRQFCRRRATRREFSRYANGLG